MRLAGACEEDSSGDAVGIPLQGMSARNLTRGQKMSSGAGAVEIGVGREIVTSTAK